MRKIKFRAWDNINKVMIKQSEFDSFHKLMTWTGLVYKEGILQDYDMLQYTGLKDKNGKEIFEGDVVKYSNDEPQAVEYKDCCFCFYLKHNKHVLRLKCFAGVKNKYEIIGNIYENPELLEK